MSLEVIRRPAVAGYLYPADRHALEAVIDRSVPFPRTAASATAVILPHSSYQRIAGILGATCGRVAVPKHCIIISPSHTGSWMPWSLMTAGAYRTPLGDVPVEGAIAEALQARCSFLEADAWAQRGEHGIEVLLPFLQRVAPDAPTLVPIVCSTEDPEALAQLGIALAQTVRMLEEPVLLIASSDLSHYWADAQTRAIDQRLIERMCALDADGLAQVAAGERANMCGVSAVQVVLAASRELGARRGEVAAYETSAALGGDPDSSTGHAGIVLA